MSNEDLEPEKDAPIDDTGEPDIFIDPRCDEGFRWDPDLNKCVRYDPEPPPEPPPEPDLGDCPFTVLSLGPFAILAAPLCALWAFINSANWDSNIGLFDSLTPLFSTVETNIQAIIDAAAVIIQTNLSKAMALGFTNLDLEGKLDAALDGLDLSKLDYLDPENEEGILAKINLLDGNITGLIEGGSVSIVDAIEGLTKKTMSPIDDILTEDQFTELKSKITGVLDTATSEEPRIQKIIDDAAATFRTSPESVTDSLIQMIMTFISPFLESAFILEFVTGPLSPEEANEARTGLISLWGIFMMVTSALDAIVEVFTGGQVEAIGRILTNVIWAFAPSSVLKDALYGDYNTAVQPVLERARRTKFRPHRLRIQEGADLFARGDLDEAGANKTFAAAGIPNEFHAGLRELSLSYPTESEVHKMKFRTDMSDEEYTRLLRKSKTPVDLIQITKDIARPIPSASDLIRFTVKEDLGAAWLNEYLSKHGYSEEWATHYWNSHWELPSVQQGYDMRARGEMTDSGLMDLMIKQDFHPDYRQQMFNIRFRLIPRVDLRRAYAAGILLYEELVERYIALGYSPEDALLEAQLQMRETLNAEISGLRSSAISEFRDGYITELQLRDRLEQIGFSLDEIEYSIATAKSQRALNIADDWIRISREKLRKGKITFDEFETEIGKYVIDAERLKTIIEFEKARIKLVDAVSVDDPSVTSIRNDLIADFVDGYLTQSELAQELRDLKMSEPEIAVHVKHGELKFENQLKDLYRKWVTELFQEEKITEVVFTESLATVIKDERKVNLLVEHELAKRKLTS